LHFYLLGRNKLQDVTPSSLVDIYRHFGWTYCRP